MNKKELIEELRKNNFSEIILKAFEKIKRENFVPEHLKSYAYNNEPLPIERGATISQPYTIAFMLNLLEFERLTNNINDKLVNNIISKNDKLGKEEHSEHFKTRKLDTTNNKIKILEIGSGSGYVLALINEIMKMLKLKNYEIYGIEINKELVNISSKLFNKNKKIKIIYGDGSKGLLEKKPFDRIIGSATFEKMPENLFKQLKNNGILATPIKNSIFQIKKTENKIKIKEFPGFVFVPVVEY